MRKYVFAVLATWVFVFAYETLVHGLALSPVYGEHKALFRPAEEGVTLLPGLITGHLFLAIGIVGLICWIGKAQSLGHAAQIGVFMGFTYGDGTAIMQFVAMPMSLTLAILWAVIEVVELALGAIVARVAFGPTS